MKTITSYMLTAPYLRKRVFPRNTPQLRYVGMLPPLQLETHGVGGPKVGEIRQALVLSRRGSRILVDAGLERPVEVVLEGAFSEAARGSIVHVKVEALEPRPRLRLVDPWREGVYPGFTVEIRDSFSAAVRILKSRGCSLIATSRKGVSVAKVLDKLKQLATSNECLALLFGAPDRGLYEIAEQEGLNLNNVSDVVVNTIPSQGVLRVRTEEALLATLAILNVLLQDSKK